MPFRLGEIRRIPRSGGTASLVIDSFRVNPWGAWVVFDDGVYFVDLDELDEDLTLDKKDEYSLKFFDVTTRQTKTIMRLPEYGGYMHVSPDREHLLVKHHEGGDVDLVLLEHWQ